MTAPTLFSQPANGTTRPPTEGVAGELAAMVIADIKHAAATAPRSLQTAVGPSELGTPCTRRLAYKILDAVWPLDKPNTDTDPWAATIGTSVHAWMAAVYAARNAELGEERYLVEHRVQLPYGVAGSCDLYDRETGRPVDWKVTSPQNLAKYRKNGPGDQYRTQIHLYALGMQLQGEQPRDVAIVFLPRGGRIDGLWVWAEPYQPQIAVDALKRYEATREALVYLDPEDHPDRWSMFPTADAYCTYCPMYLPQSTDLARGCPGHNTRK